MKFHLFKSKLFASQCVSNQKKLQQNQKTSGKNKSKNYKLDEKEREENCELLKQLFQFTVHLRALILSNFDMLHYFSAHTNNINSFIFWIIQEAQ